MKSTESLRAAASRPSLETLELRKRMRRPQRHRLMHGYPLARAMTSVDVLPSESQQRLREQFRFSTNQRGLQIGVLPHPFCNPQVRGCGFCTFPHQQFHVQRSREVVDRVTQEMRDRVASQPEMLGRRIRGIYFGGGTANLTPTDGIRKLCRQLRELFDTSDAEVTLEGVPAYFVKRRPLLVDVLREELPARQFRISMGIQSFDPDWIERMGRTAFGDASSVASAIQIAHERGLTISGDLLFNLPNQSLEAMRADVDRAIEMGLDHLGLYHLVMFRGLGTAWSQDAELLAGLPGNSQAAEHWLALRESVLERGFYQTSLTNFERRVFQRQPHRFQYEENSFRPHRFEMLGFGPGDISFSASANFDAAWKTLNPENAEEYVTRLEGGQSTWNRFFTYSSDDLRGVHLTRRLSALQIDRREYHGLFQSDPLSDFAAEWQAISDERLVTIHPDRIEPTPLGMFYADSVSALVAWRRMQHHRIVRANESADVFMG